MLDAHETENCAKIMQDQMIFRRYSLPPSKSYSPLYFSTRSTVIGDNMFGTEGVIVSINLHPHPRAKLIKLSISASLQSQIMAMFVVFSILVSTFKQSITPHCVSSHFLKALGIWRLRNFSVEKLSLYVIKSRCLHRAISRYIKL